MTDVVERLRERAMELSGRSIDRGCVDSGISANLADTAADEIERLTAALKLFARYADHFDSHEYNDPSRPLLYKDDDHPLDQYGPTIGELRQARAAITTSQRAEK